GPVGWQGTLLVRTRVSEAAALGPTRTWLGAKGRRAYDLRGLRVVNLLHVIAKVQIAARPAQRNAQQIRVVTNVGIAGWIECDNDAFHRGVLAGKLGANSAGKNGAAPIFGRWRVCGEAAVDKTKEQ